MCSWVGAWMERMTFICYSFFSRSCSASKPLHLSKYETSHLTLVIILCSLWGKEPAPLALGTPFTMSQWYLNRISAGRSWLHGDGITLSVLMGHIHSSKQLLYRLGGGGREESKQKTMIVYSRFLCALTTYWLGCLKFTQNFRALRPCLVDERAWWNERSPDFVCTRPDTRRGL